MKYLISFIILSCFFINNLFSQEIKANVIVNTDQIAAENLQNVSSLASDLRNYINSQKFTDIAWDGEPIPVDISIYMSGGNRGYYTAKMFVMSKRMLDAPKDKPQGQSVALKLIENEWGFIYNMGANLSFNTLRFDQFISVIDFYMLLIIGFDLDSYGELDGTPVFDKAKIIFQLGANAGASGFKTFTPMGEFTKYNLISEITDMRYNDFRKIIYSYYVDCLDKLDYDKEKGLKSLENVIYNLVQFKQKKLSGPSVFLQLFFDTKAQELAALLNGYQNTQVFRDLIYLDPGSTMLYNDSKDGKIK